MYNVTYTCALYALLLFYMGTHELLAPFNPLLKFARRQVRRLPHLLAGAAPGLHLLLFPANLLCPASPQTPALTHACMMPHALIPLDAVSPSKVCSVHYRACVGACMWTARSSCLGGRRQAVPACETLISRAVHARRACSSPSCRWRASLQTVTDGKNLQNLLICLEMLPAALGMMFAFPYTEYKGQGARSQLLLPGTPLGSCHGCSGVFSSLARPIHCMVKTASEVFEAGIRVIMHAIMQPCGHAPHHGRGGGQGMRAAICTLPCAQAQRRGWAWRTCGT